MRGEKNRKEKKKKLFETGESEIQDQPSKKETVESRKSHRDSEEKERLMLVSFAGFFFLVQCNSSVS